MKIVSKILRHASNNPLEHVRALMAAVMNGHREKGPSVLHVALERSVVDSATLGADFQVPLPMFSGRIDDWPVWSARFGAYAELAGWTAVLEVAEAQTAPITVVGASPDAIRLGKIIYAVVLTKTEGKAFSIVHLTPW